MNIVRGVRRAGWVVIAVIVAFAGVLAYEQSTVASGFTPTLLESGFPAQENMSRTRAVPVEGMGLVHFPTALSRSEVDAFLKEHFTIEANPSAFSVSPGKHTIKSFADALRNKYATSLAARASPKGKMPPKASVPEVLTDEEFALRYPTDPIIDMFEGIDTAASESHVMLTKRALTLYPEYRKDVAFREYLVEPRLVKRPGWAFGVACLVGFAATLIIQGGISVAAWVARGFASS